MNVTDEDWMIAEWNWLGCILRICGRAALTTWQARELTLKLR